MRTTEEVLFDICRLSCGGNREEKRKGQTRENRKGLTRSDVVVLLVIIGILLSIGAVRLLDRATYRNPGYRAFCGTNLKGLGTAMTVYANDYDDNYPQLPGRGPWSKRLGFDYAIEDPDFGFGGEQEHVGRTITASWYLLVREADVSPWSFVCPTSYQTRFRKNNLVKSDVTELWDFGPDPYKHVSYSMHNPYGRYPANGTKSAAFAVAADMSPWFIDGSIIPPGANNDAPQIIRPDDPQKDSPGNSQNHPEYRRRFWLWRPVKGTRMGQNVLFGDGHSSFEKSANCGVGKDNIYTFFSKDEEPSEQDRQGGTNPTARDKGNDAGSEEDSFLGI